MPQELCQAVPLDEEGKLKQEALNLRLHELQVIDMCFLDNQGVHPQLLVLYEAPDVRPTQAYAILVTLVWQQLRHVKLYTMDLTRKELDEGEDSCRWF